MAAPNQYAAPNATEYGGDEVSAIVLDPGFSTTRAGFAGEDVPKSVVPTHYGIYSIESGDRELLFGDNSVHTPLPGLEIQNPLAGEGAEEWVSDWDAATKLWEYTITSRLISPHPTKPFKNGDGDLEMDGLNEAERPLAENPLLMTEPGISSQKSRERLTEIAMENWGAPAFWLGRSGVLAAFSAGKASALVIDIGASMVSVTPVIDGMIIKKGVKTSPLAGNFVSQQIRLVFSQSQPPVPLRPYYTVHSKVQVDAGAPPQAEYRKFETPPTESFRLFEEERVLTEFKESVVQTWEGPGRLSSGAPPGTTNLDVVKSWPGRPFEMPDGWNQVFGAERFRPAEALFDENAAITDSEHPKPKPEQTIPRLIAASLNAVDQDSRANLIGNMVVVGGSSLLQGLVRRLDQEMTSLYSGLRVRIAAPSSSVERKYASWIGGSILASLGTFHQMWISKKEYDEHGPGIIENRAK